MFPYLRKIRNFLKVPFHSDVNYNRMTAKILNLVLDFMSITNEEPNIINSCEIMYGIAR